MAAETEGVLVYLRAQPDKIDRQGAKGTHRVSAVAYVASALFVIVAFMAMAAGFAPSAASAYNTCPAGWVTTSISPFTCQRLVPAIETPSLVPGGPPDYQCPDGYTPHGPTPQKWCLEPLSVRDRATPTPSGSAIAALGPTATPLPAGYDPNDPETWPTVAPTFTLTPETTATPRPGNYSGAPTAIDCPIGYRTSRSSPNGFCERIAASPEPSSVANAYAATTASTSPTTVAVAPPRPRPTVNPGPLAITPVAQVAPIVIAAKSYGFGPAIANPQRSSMTPALAHTGSAAELPTRLALGLIAVGFIFIGTRRVGP